MEAMSAPDKAAVQKAIDACYASRPGLAMVDSARGITNLHVPSDVIIDASMPCVVRDSGKMWNKEDALEDVICIIPDRCYATMYEACLQDCRKNGQFDVSTMGSVSNVGLMAKKAEEYGSHDKTFELPCAGKVQVVDNQSHEVVMAHDVAAGDIWRMCQTKDAPIRDWAPPRWRTKGPRVRGAPTPCVAGIGAARRRARTRDRRRRHLLARSEPRPRPIADCEGRDVPQGPRHSRPLPLRQEAGRRDRRVDGARARRCEARRRRPCVTRSV